LDYSFNRHNLIGGEAVELPPFLHHLYQMMKQYTLSQAEIIEVVKLLMWAYTRHIVLWFTGEEKRCKRIEYNLPRIVDKGGLKVFKEGQKFVYTLPGNKANDTAHMEHGLICAECLLRFKLSQTGEFVSERFFREFNFKPIPEWAVKYDKGIILFEYSTADNFRRSQLMKKKVQQYQQNLHQFEQYFGKSAGVLFVFQAPRDKVEKFVQENGDESFYFVDLDSFMRVERGGQLQAPIYFWGGDGQSYPLS
jgi:hypothetical protein